MTKFQLSNQKQYCLRWIFEAKAVLLLTLKQYCFWSIFEAKAVLLLVHFWSKSSAKWKKKIQLALFFPIFWGKNSTAFVQLLNQKQHCFIPIFGPKVVAVFKVMNLYLWCLLCNLGMWYHFLHLQNLSNSIMTLACTIKRSTLRHILRPEKYPWCLTLCDPLSKFNF